MLLVTGITGHSGKYFLKELIKNDYSGPIRCVVRSNSDTSLIDDSVLMIEKVVGDLDDQAFMNSATKDVDTILHIASIFHSKTVMKAAIANKVRRAILVHTTGIYSKYKSATEEYQNIEQAIKQMIHNKQSDIGLIYLRPTMIYGYLDDRNMIVFIKMIDKLRLFPIINKGENLLQPVNGRDLGIAYYQVLMRSEIMSGNYILSGDKPIAMKDMFKLISQLLQKKTYFVNVPMGLAIFLAKVLKTATFGKIDYVEKVLRMGEDRHFSHDEGTRDFGYSPMPFSEGLRLEIRDYIKSKN